MTEPLHFMMGQYKAIIPTDRMYSARHMWLQEQEPGILQVGFTAYSVRLLQDVYFLEWSIDAGTPVRDRQDIGEVESSKAVSAMFPPCAGEVIDFNDGILADPSAINADSYGSGWLYTFRTTETLLTPEQYIQVLEDGWDATQRTIKGQMN